MPEKTRIVRPDAKVMGAKINLCPAAGFCMISVSAGSPNGKNLASASGAFGAKPQLN